MIGQCTTWGWCIIKCQRASLTFWFIFVLPRHFAILTTTHLFFGFLALRLRCTKLPNRSLMFDTQCLYQFTEWFYFNRIFSRHWWVMLVNPSGVDTNASSIIALYWCLSSILTAVLYKFFVFSRHICSYKALLLNYWSTSMATMVFSSCSNWNDPLIITHFCSN